MAFRQKSLEVELVDAVQRNQHQQRQVRDKFEEIASVLQGGPPLRPDPRSRSSLARVGGSDLQASSTRIRLGPSASTPQLLSPYAGSGTALPSSHRLPQIAGEFSISAPMPPLGRDMLLAPANQDEIKSAITAQQQEPRKHDFSKSPRAGRTTPAEKQVTSLEVESLSREVQEMRRSLAEATTKLEAMMKERDSALAEKASTAEKIQELKRAAVEHAEDLQAMKKQRDTALTLNATQVDVILSLKERVAEVEELLGDMRNQKDESDSERCSELESQLEAMTKERDLHRSYVARLTLEREELAKDQELLLFQKEQACRDLDGVEDEHTMTEVRLAEVTEQLDEQADAMQKSMESLAVEFHTSLAESVAKWAVESWWCTAWRNQCQESSMEHAALEDALEDVWRSRMTLEDGT